jgi:RND family efflux transporter MFP subunit
VLDAYPDWNIPAKVRTVIPTADRQKATVKVRIAFNKLDPRILPDMGAKVTFLGSDAKQSQGETVKALVPQAAVRKDGGSDIVYLYREGRVERRAVRVGGLRGDEQEIIAGLAGGDQIVVNGFEDLHDGSRVEIKR